MTEQQARQAVLLEALQHPETWPHPVDEVVHIETHISHVLLAGEYAYKIKKPLDLGFLDFSSLEKRRFYCEEELRLNRRLAPQLYQAVTVFSGEPSSPDLDGGGQPFEFAVRMRRFDPNRELDKLLERGELSAEWIDLLAERVARFHDEIPAAGEASPMGTPQAVLAPAEENFAQLAALDIDPTLEARLDQLRAWTLREHERLHPLLARRHQEGFIRECHGDMHLGNMAEIDGNPVIFDGIEFSETLRWIDVLSEVAFVTMDLRDRGAPAFAWRFLDGWLAHTGDYEGLPLLRFYEVYRAMVRAKVAGIRAGQTQDRRQRDAAANQCDEYLELAEALARPTPKALFINHGLSGSGKTTLSQPLVEKGMIRIRSDVERKRLAGMEATERGDSGVGSGLYGQDVSERTYARMEQLGESVINAGLPVIIDATFLERERRRRFAELAERLEVPFAILDYRAPAEILRERVRRRAADGRDASDAGLAVLEHQLETAAPLEEDEPVIVIDTDRDTAPPLERIREIMMVPYARCDDTDLNA